MLLEAMACGTPVIATDIWGTPEVVNTPDAGILMARRDPAALVDAWRELFSNLRPREAVRKHAEHFDWFPTSDAQLALFGRAIKLKPPKERAIWSR